VSLLTAHKIFIGSAIALFAGYGLRELERYFQGDSTALVRSLLSGAGTVALVLYLRWVWRRWPQGLGR